MKRKRTVCHATSGRPVANDGNGVKEQVGHSVCGLFAIAYATGILHWLQSGHLQL